MEVRKLVKSGLSSYTVALPKNWIENNKLSKGDLIYLDEIDNKILVTSKQSKEKKTYDDIVIHTEGKTLRQIRREIRNAYLNNFNRIFIKGANLRPIATEIKNDIHSLVSLEVVEETSDKITARSFFNFADLSIPDVLRRMDNITRSMLADCIIFIKEPSKEYDIAQTIMDRDTDVNRLTFMVFKILLDCASDINKAKKLDISTSEMLRYWNLTFVVEKVADNIKRAAKAIRQCHERKIKINKNEMISIATAIKQSYENVMTAFYKKDNPLSDEVYLVRRTLIEQCDNFLHKNKSLEGALYIFHMKNIITEIDDINKIIRF